MEDGGSEITSRNIPSETIIAQVMKNEELIRIRDNIGQSKNSSLVPPGAKSFGFQYSIHAGKFTEVFDEIVKDERVPFGLRKIRKPRWFYHTAFGEPRGVDLIKIRTLAKSWAFQSCMTTQIQKIRSIEGDFVPRDKDKVKDPIIRSRIRQIKEIAKNVNVNNESLKDVYLQALIDAFEIDAFCVAKTFYEEAVEWVDLVEVGFDPNEFVNDPDSQVQWYVPLNAPKGYMGGVDAIDGGRVLKQYDHTNFVLGYWEHNYGRALPKFYSKREIAYLPMNKSPYDSYGWSYAQQLEDVLKAIIAAVMNTTKFSERGNIAPGLLVLQGMDKEGYDEFRDYWVNQLMGQPHRFGTVRVPAEGSIKWMPLNFTSNDITFLDGTDFYWRIVMAVTHTTPSSMGITDSVNRSTSEEQAKVQDRISQAPLLDLVHDFISKHWLAELDIFDEIEYIWKPSVDLDTENKREDLRTKQLANWKTTVNELRKEDGEDPVWWGNIPKELLLAHIQASQIPGDFTQDPSGINLSQSILDIVRQIDIDSALAPEGIENVLDENIARINQEIMEIQAEAMVEDIVADAQAAMNALMEIQQLIEQRSDESEKKIEEQLQSLISLDLGEAKENTLNALDKIKELLKVRTEESTREIQEMVSQLISLVEDVIFVSADDKLKASNSKKFENVTEIKMLSDKIIIKKTEYRGVVMKELPEDETTGLTEGQERTLSTRIDDFIEKPINEISNTMNRLLEEWKEALIQMVYTRLKEGMEVTQAIIDAVMVISAPDGQLAKIMTNELSEVLELVFIEALRLNNDMEEDALPVIFSGEADQEIRFLRNNAFLVSDKITSDLEGQLRRALIEGLSKGESIGGLADRVQGVFNSTPARAEVVARTETIRAMVNARHFSMDKAGAERWEFFAHLDDRVDGECRGLHGKTFPMDDRTNMPPIHPNCRCTILAIIPDEDDIDEEDF